MIKPVIKKLSNGITIVLDYVPTVSSATVGIWTNIGSKVENKDNNGICHFLEHMVFKGTKNRTSFEISEHIEQKGGYMNAYTSKEKTVWYAKVLKEDVNLALDILFDILLNSNFPKEELAKEKGVIIEELKMYLDSPQDIAHNLYDKLCYGNHPIGAPIIGVEENIKKFSSDDFLHHIQTYYIPSEMVVVISGNYDEKSCISLIEELTKDCNDATLNLQQEIPTFNSNKDVFVKQDVEQTVVLYGRNALSYKHDDYLKLSIYNAIMGAGMSSRLFVEIREKRGLAYYADSFLNSYSDCGTFTVQVGCNKQNTLDVIELIEKEIQKTNFTDAELTKAKNQIKSSIIMSLENTLNRAERIASNMLNYGKIKDIHEITKKIDNVNLNDMTYIKELLHKQEPTIAIVSSEKINI